jgi:ribosomal protein RSM22 (predicted rRNA methylase)
MQLPAPLRQAIERETANHSLRALAQAAVELSEKYREQQSQSEPFIVTEAHRLAYIAARMPATFAALRRIFAEIRRAQLPIHSLLDLGAGPGTAAWAAVEVFEKIKRSRNSNETPI